MRSFFCLHYKLVLCISLCFLFGLNAARAQVYCTPSYSTGCDWQGNGLGDYIKSFSTTGGSTNITNNNTLCTNLTSNAYSYYPTQNHTGIQNTVVNFSFTNNPNFTEEYRIWVDWNDDGDFIDAGEQVYSSNGVQAATNQIVTGSFMIPATATPGTTRLRIRCTDTPSPTYGPCNSETFGEAEDYDFTIIPSTPCSGTPTSTITSNTTTLCSSPVNLSYSGTYMNGLNYQWQSAPQCTTNWTNIPNATNSTYTISSLSSTTQYRLVLGCNTSGLFDTSSVITISTVCYCSTSTALFTARDDIGQMIFNGVANPAVTPTALTNNPSSNGTYSNLTGLSPIVVAPGGTYPFEVTQIDQFTYYQCYLKVFIDLNQDGDFSDPGEQVFNQGGPAAPVSPTFSGSITIPGNATGGLTRMRIVLANGGSLSSVTPCINYAWGETEDYTLLIQSQSAASSNSPICSGNTLTLFGSTSGACASYSWTGPNSFSSTLQNPTIPGASPLATGQYILTVTSNGTPISDTVDVVVGDPTTDSVYVTICGNSSITFGSTVINTPGTYLHTFQTPAGCDSTVTLFVTVSPVTPLPTITSPIPYCQGAITTQLTATGTALLWYTLPTGGPAGSTTAPTPSSVSAGTTHYYVSQTLNNCESNRADISVIINPLPVIGSTGAINPTTCNGSNGSISLTGLIPGTAYTLNYTKNTNPVGPVSVTSNSSGTVNITGLTAGTYANINLTANNCTSANAGPVTLTDPLPPAAPVAGSNSPVCSGSPLNLNASTIAGATYSWNGPSFSSSLQNPVISYPVTSDSGVYTVTATVNNCVSIPDTLVVTVKATPPGPGMNNLDLCQFEAAGPLTASGQNILWYTSAGGTGSPVAPVPSTLLPSSTVYLASQTINGCESTPLIGMIVTVNAKPAPPVTTPAFYCQGQVAPALTATGQNLLWYTSATTGTGSATAPIPSTATTGTFHWYVSQTVNGCESDRADKSVEIGLTLPAPVVTSPVSYCQYSPISPALASFVTGTNVLWYTSQTGGTGSATAPYLDSSIAVNITYYVATSTGVCESARLPITVHVHPKPAPPAVTDLVYCQYSQPGSLTAQGQNLTWYPQSLGGGGTSTAPALQTTTTGVFHYYVTQTINGCESERADISVEIITKPAQPAVTPSYVYCQYEDYALPLEATGQLLKWYTQASGGVASTTTPIPSTNVPGVFNWYVSQTIGGCESDRSLISVTINPKPAAPGVNTPIIYCEGDNALQLSATGQNLRWYSSPADSFGVSAAPTPYTDTVSTSVYYVSQTQLGCESERSVIEVTVNPKVNANIISSETVICQFDTITVENDAYNPPTAAFNWKFNNASVLSGSGAGPFQLSWDTAGKKSVVLIVTNLNCSARDTLDVTIKPSPAAAFGIEDMACKEDIVSVQSSFGTLGASIYTWDFDGATILSGGGPGTYKLKWLTAGIKSVSLITTLNGCHSLPFYDTITIHDPVQARIDLVSRRDICSGDTVQLGTEYRKAGSYLWTPERFILDNGQRLAMASVQTTGYIYLDASDEFGCTSRDSVFITTKPCCDIALPDAFTPNGDGRNDKFHIITQGQHPIAVFRIVNRWGQTMYESDNEAEGWDGTFQNVPQPMGSYNYYLKFRCGDGEMIDKKGEVMLIR